MNQLHAMRVFCCLVQAQGFSAAAERLETTHSSVSRHLQQLESALGVRLVNRTTRQLSLTGAGQEYYSACIDILERVDAAAAALGEQHAPSGRLRVSVPLVVGTLELGQWLPAFEARYPQVQLELSCADRFVDLVAEGFDVALRISAALADSSLVARLLHVSPMVLVAAPGYLARHTAPQTAPMLADHRLLCTAGGGDWQLHGAGEIRCVAAGSGLRADSITTLHAAALAGAGIAAFTQATVQADLLAGRLLRVLPQYTLGDRQYHALYPHTRHLPGKVRAFVDFMVEHYAQVKA